MQSPFTSGRPRVWRESDGVSALPHVWSAYRFIGVKGIDYIGITSNLYKRINHHRTVKHYYNPEVHTVHYQIPELGVSWKDLCNWERRKIADHSPNLIKYSGGNGKPPVIQINGETVELLPDESVEDALVEMGFFDRLKSLLRIN